MKVYLTTLGWPENQADSELLLGVLTEAGSPLTTASEGVECLLLKEKDLGIALQFTNYRSV